MIFNVTAVFDIVENYLRTMSLPEEVSSALRSVSAECNAYFEKLGQCAYDIDEIDYD